MSLIASTDGTIVTGGGSDRSALRIEPTVIVNPSPSDAVMAEEIFGPMLPILTVESTDAAVEFVNSRPKPLALYVFTDNRRLGRDIIDRDPSGGAVINHVDDALPGTATAVRRRRCQRNGCLPRPMGIRDTQPPPRGAGQAGPGPTRR